MAETPQQTATEETVRQRLARLMDERREELGLHWNEVAEDAGITKEGLRSVRFEVRQIRPKTKRGLERALDWDAGSFDRILEGGDPVTTEFKGLALMKNESDQYAAIHVKHENPETVSKLVRMVKEMGRERGFKVYVTSEVTDSVVQELEKDPDLPDDLKQKFIEGYRSLREEVAEALRQQQRKP
jgi:hypothetical protein